MMKIGYARVSTDEQRMDLQMHALQHSGCDKIFTDQGISGKILSRPGLDAALRKAKRGDTLVVWRLDRLGRSLIGLVQMIENLGDKGVDFVSLSEAIDTSSSGGRLVFHMMAALSEFERTLISERTKAGMDAARRKGTHVGRPPALTWKQVDAAYHSVLINREEVSLVADRYGVSSRTLKKWLGLKSELLATDSHP